MPSRYLFAASLLTCIAFSQTSVTEPSAAEKLYRSGKFAEAAEGYKAVLASKPDDVDAEVGLIRSYLRLDKPDDAYTAATKALASHPQNAAVTAMMGEVQFRRAEMPEAERTWAAAYKLDHKEFHALLGLAKLYRAYSLYRHSYDVLNAAHMVAPDDIDVQREWFARLPRRERLAAMEAYLASSHPDDEEETEYLQHYIAFLKATVDQPVHACKLVSKLDETTTRLEPLRNSPTRIDAFGLNVQVNGKTAKLELDTGASGIVIGSRLAEQARLTRVSQMKLGGIGDKGAQTGFYAVADHLRIGELEFQDCVVRVSDRKTPMDRDGLIGADVFASYLIDIDIPGQRLKLSPLPKRPDEVEAPKALESEGESQASAKEGSTGADAKSAAPRRVLPKDRYVAPEMANWSRIFHFGHMLLFPTFVNDRPRPMLFLLDTGAFANTLSMKTAREVGKPYEDPRMRVKGLSGTVKTVFRVDDIKLQFGHFVAPKQTYVAFDQERMSRSAGTEVSGTLGFDMLRQLEVKIDYRDGLIDFNYDPKRVRPQ